MADNMIELVAKLNEAESIRVIQDQLNDKIAPALDLKIKCSLNKDGISNIQTQLAKISQNMAINIPDIKIGGGVDSSNVSKLTGSISTIYAEGAKQTETLRRKQQLLQQDYDILSEKIKKTKQNIDELATSQKTGINYNKVFTDLMSKNIADYETLGRAKDALAAIRKEFQLLNAKVSSDLPQNAIENITQKISKLGNQVKNVEIDFSRLNNAPQDLKAKFDELGSLARGFDFSPNLQGESKEALNERVKQYTRIKNLTMEVQSEIKLLTKVERNASRDTSLSNRIKKLTADMDAYAVANQRAINSTKQMSNGKSFASEWERLSDAMAKGASLRADELKHLNEEFRTFGKEAEAAGLKGESAFGKFLNSFKTMSSYITANMVFNFVKRQLRDMVQEVTAVDSAMVDLRKVTDATDEEFEAFAKSAGKTGRELGASISDVINATSTFSRAGFSLPEAEELGKIATLYKNVGDGIDIESASESLISVIKAFNIQAGEYERIVDKINNVSNNFAIDSGGLGLALQRVASAMDAANNTLDETIALTTVANEVVQNPEMVAQGWRTVALRIRGAKTELEDAGLETEGMVESTAKLRDLIKGISGVDIMLDENTFKSTYEIIEEIGKVWKDINDVNQASLLEAIAGKRQSNIVAAALNNYERLDQVLEKSINSENSARKEQEEYAKSIQYSIDTLKATYQDFAQTVIESDFVKEILSTGQTLLETITKIVDKVGLLPPLLASVATAMAFKNKGIFGTVKSDAEGANRQITLFGKTFSRIKEDIQTSDTKGLAKVKTAISSIGLQAKVTQAAVVAMNAALNIGISLAVSAAVSAISKWVNKEKEAKEQAEALKKEMEERRDAAYESISIYNDEKKAINSLIGEYVKLVATTDDISTIKDDLLSIQDQIVDKYGREVEAIDLVNNSLRENLNLLAQKDEEANRSWKTENYEAIEEAKSFFDDSGALDALSIFSIDWEDYYEGSAAKQEAEAYVSALKNALEEAGVSDLFDFSEYVKANESNLAESYRYSVNFVSGLTREQVQTAAEEYAKAYEKVMEDQAHWQDYFNLAGDRYKYVLNYLDDISKRTNILDRLDESDLNQEIWDALKRNTEDYDNYLNLVSKATELTAKLNSPETTLGEKNSLALELDTVKSSLIDLGDKYPVVANAISQEIKGLGLDLTTFTDTVDSAKESWLESLDAAQKGVITDVDKIIAAMKKLYSGEAIDQKSAWDIINLDTEGILSNITIDQNGNYIFQLDQMVALKDSLIGKEIDLRNESIATAKQNLANAKMELEAEELRFEVVSMQLAAAKAPGSMAKNVSALEEEYNNLKRSIEINKKAVDSYNLSITNESLLTEQLQKRTGDLSDTLEMLTAQQTKLKNEIDALKKSQEQLKNEISDLNSQADRMLKAQETKIDQIVDGLEAEEQVLENDKALLQEQLDILEEQKEQLENIIEQYKSVADIVGNTISDQIDEIKKNQQAVEDYYNELIDKLKSENKERSDALDYAEKLAALENAKNNKVKVYGNGTGWTYMVDQDALAKAQRALEEADEDKAIQELEAQRDAEVKAFDVQISAFEEYADEWKAIVDSIQAEDDERLAQEILGSDWREKISIKDIKILQSFKSEYRNYNSQLTILTNNEIKNLEASIAAKDKEIDAKKKQIQVWKDYKSEVENTVNTIKNTLENYEDLLNQIVLDENSTYEDRRRNLSNFANKYSDIISQISRKNSELDTATSRIENLNNQITQLNNNPITIEADVSSAADEMADFIEKYRDAVEAMRKRLEESVTGFGVVNSAWDAQLAEAANAMRRMGSYSQGGSVAYTGLAQVHGSPNKSETVFNAAQSRDLWNMVRSGQFSNLVAEKAIQGINFDLKNLSPNSNTSNRTVNIGQMTIKTDNPKQFHSQFMTEMKQYWNVQLSESPIN